jgi:hypothetical protein
MRLHLVTAAVAGSITLSAFLLGCSTTVTATISPPAGCAVDNSLGCVHNATGFTCTPGDNPELEDSSLSCSIPVTDSSGNDDFCCFQWTGTTCTPDDTITQFCDASSFGYACAPGDTPQSLDPSLNCSAPHPNGNEDDFCCN